MSTSDFINNIITDYKQEQTIKNENDVKENQNIINEQNQNNQVIRRKQEKEPYLIIVDYSERFYNYFLGDNKYYSMKDENLFWQYFFPENVIRHIKFKYNKNILFDEKNSNANKKIHITLYSYDDAKNNVIKNNSLNNSLNNSSTNKTNNVIKKINLYINIENLYRGKLSYQTKVNNRNLKNSNNIKNLNNANKENDIEKFFEKDNIDIYLYNHLDKIIINEKYFHTPIIHSEINYFLKNKDNISPSIETPWEEKKFCLFASVNSINAEKKQVLFKALREIDECNRIKEFYDEIGNETCYNSQKMLNIFNRYKFVFVCENSLADGYITEKIFNVFFAKTIPIYWGSEKIYNYINKDSFICLNDLPIKHKYKINSYAINRKRANLNYEAAIDYINNLKTKINNLKDNKDLYYKMLNQQKINSDYNNENYNIELENYIYNKI
jgi:hypothetical protein